MASLHRPQHAPQATYPQLAADVKPFEALSSPLSSEDSVAVLLIVSPPIHV